MIAETVPVQETFLRTNPTRWKRKHLGPLPPIESEVMGMVSRVLKSGWGPSDPLRGKRSDLLISPSAMARHGGKKSPRKYRAAISSLISKHLLVVTGLGSRGARIVRPSILWINRGEGPSQGPSGVSCKTISSNRITPIENGTCRRLVRTEVRSTPVVSQPSKTGMKAKTPVRIKSRSRLPLRFRTDTPTDKRSEFLGLVRSAYKVNQDGSVFAVANLQLKTHQIDFLLPIWREATSPTSGIQTPLAWIRIVTRRKAGRGMMK